MKGVLNGGSQLGSNNRLANCPANKKILALMDPNKAKH